MPETLGPYTLDKRIGSGGMADIFLAHGPMGLCVVKRPHAHLCANPEFLRMFLDEASLLAQLHHPGIAQIYDLGRVGNVTFLSMEYVHGFDLMTISIEHERTGELMPPEVCARVVADAAQALHYAHNAVGKSGERLNIIHRDVSPHNILLSTTGVVKLIDFGVARASSATHRTQAGLVKGKYPYMSPEQITGQSLDHRADVYALGLVLYELLTNVRAIPGDNDLVQIDNARSSRIRPVEQLRGNVPERLKQVLVRALQPLAADRYQSAQALKDDLEAYLASEHHVLGQEDLLRLFRVVAADLQQLAPGDAVDLKAVHLTEREQPIQAVIAAPGLTPEMASDPALGVAHTEPSVAVAVSDPGTDDTLPRLGPAVRSASSQPIPLTAAERVGPGAALAVPPKLAAPQGPSPVPAPAGVPPRRSLLPLVATALLVASLLGLGLVALLKEGGAASGDLAPADGGALVAAVTPPSVDAGALLGVVMPAGPDADAGTDRPPTAAVGAADSGSAVPVKEPVAEDPRIAVVPVSCVIPADVYVGGKRYGRTPYELELAAGTHTISVVNREQFLRWTKKLTLNPGERRALAVEVGTGIISARPAPFGLIKVDGVALGPTPVSFKEITVYEGTHVVEFRLEDSGKSKTWKSTVSVRAGETTTVEHRFELPL